MRITSKVGLLSVLIALLFAFSTLWVLPAGADSVGPTKGKAKHAQAKSPKSVKKTVRAKKLNAVSAQTKAAQVTPTPVCYTCPPGTTAYTWNTAATYGSGSTGPQAQPITPQAQVTVPVTQPLASQVPATVCYNPCVSCWNVPTNAWNVSATSGAAPQTTLQRLLPPLPRPGVAQRAAAQPQASTAPRPVCPSLAPSWWPSWASLCK